MMALHSRLTTTMFVLACTLCAVGPIRVRAQEVTTASENGGKCPTAGAPLVDPLSGPHWNGWGVDSSQHRFQPSMMAQLAPDDVPRLKLKWAFGYPGAVRAFAQPTIVSGRLFVGSQSGKVYSLDSDSGCKYWEFDARNPVHSSIVIDQQAGGWSAYFGDFGANVHAVDALTGRQLWKTRIDDHPAARITGSPALVGATLFVPVSSIEEGTGANPNYSCCSFRGSVVALEASTGKLRWKSYTIAQEAERLYRLAHDNGLAMLALQAGRHAEVRERAERAPPENSSPSLPLALAFSRAMVAMSLLHEGDAFRVDTFLRPLLRDAERDSGRRGMLPTPDLRLLSAASMPVRARSAIRTIRAPAAAARRSGSSVRRP